MGTLMNRAAKTALLAGGLLMAGSTVAANAATTDLPLGLANTTGMTNVAGLDKVTDLVAQNGLTKLDSVQLPAMPVGATQQRSLPVVGQDLPTGALPLNAVTGQALPVNALQGVSVAGLRGIPALGQQRELPAVGALPVGQLPVGQLPVGQVSGLLQGLPLAGQAQQRDLPALPDAGQFTGTLSKLPVGQLPGLAG